MAFALPGPGTVGPPIPKPKPRVAPNPLGGVYTDPAFVQAQLAHQQALGQANAALRQQRSQTLIGYGSPELARSLGDAVDPNTAAAAGANQYSTLANLGHANDLARRRIVNVLAGRGLAHSGALGFQQGEQARAYGQAQYDAGNQLLDALNQQLGGYLGSVQGANNDYVNQLLLSYYGMLGNPLGVRS